MSRSAPPENIAVGRIQMMRIAAPALSLTAAFAVAAASLQAQSFSAGPGLTIPSGEVREGNLYAAAESVRVDGRLDGDLFAATNRVVVDGSVDGDVFVAANTIELRGPISDSTRVAGQTLTVDTTIDGNLLAAVRELVMTGNARITGGLVGAAARMEIDGTVEDGIRLVAGEILIRGTVLGDARLIADRVDLAPGARIAGDLHYQARAPLDAEAAARVAGVVRYDEPVDESASDGPPWGVLLWSWQMLAALLTGLVAIALFRGSVQRLAATLAAEATLSALLGFAAFLLIPVAAGVASLTLVGLPIGLAAAVLFGVALYAAKLPIAVWIGSRLLGQAGHPTASPYAAMALGVVLLYLLFAVPYVGWLFWFGATWLGLGTMVVSGRRHLELRAGTS